VLFLDQIFDKFCAYFEGRLKWHDSDERWTQEIFAFFSKENAAQIPLPYVENREHMEIDYIWRYNRKRYSINDIELALESENQEKRVDELISHEIKHLVDIRAHYKIAILNPSMGDEDQLIDKISGTIKGVSEGYRIPEEYLIILAYPTTMSGRRAILWRGYFFDKNGKETNMKEKRVLQRQEDASSVSVV